MVLLSKLSACVLHITHGEAELLPKCSQAFTGSGWGLLLKFADLCERESLSSLPPVFQFRNTQHRLVPTPLAGPYDLLGVAIRYTIDRARRIVFTNWNGEVSVRDLEAYLKRLNSDPDFDSALDQLVDTTDVSAMNFSYNSLNTIQHLDPFSMSSKRAIVAPSDITYGFARMYSAIRGGRFTVFRNMNEAVEWLGTEMNES